MNSVHAAGADAKKGGAALKATVVGIVIALVAFLISCYAQSAAMATLAGQVSDTLKQQCASYDKLVVADRTKSLFRLADMLEELSGHFVEGGDVLSDEFLEQRVDDMRISGIAVLDGDLNLEASGYTRSFSGANWEDTDLGANIADIASNPAKVLAERVKAGSDYYDVCVVARRDAPGLIVGFYKQPTGLVANMESDLASLLTGLRLDREGDYAIVEDGVARAASDGALLGASESDDGLLSTLSSMENDGNLHLVREGNSILCGYRSASGSYDLYVYYPLWSLLSAALFSMGVVCVVYLALCLGYFAIRNRELYKNQEKLALANDAKSEFLRRMSHDIRTPINGIKGYLDMAAKHPEDLELQQKCREGEAVAIEALMALVNSVLDMVKLEGSDVVLEKAEFDLERLLDNVYMVVAPQARQRNISCEVSVAPDGANAHMLGSPRYVGQLLTNLLNNAIKYGKEGGRVRMTARVTRVKGSAAMCEFVCEDDGIGMSEQFQKCMFEPFTQESSSARTTYQGSGLGLSIVKKLVDAMDGTIRVDSRKGEGTTFTVQIPFGIAQSVQEEPAAGHDGDVGSLKGMHILLVEDNELNMEIAELMLVDAGARVTKAWNGREAVDAFAASQPGEFDAIVTDIMMPVMDGLEEARAIRALDRPDAKTVLILAASANAFADDVQASLDAGINMHLAKPIDSEKVQRAIAQARAK